MRQKAKRKKGKKKKRILTVPTTKPDACHSNPQTLTGERFFPEHAHAFTAIPNYSSPSPPFPFSLQKCSICYFSP